MCNRYSVSKRELLLKTRHGLIQVGFEPRYNISPTQGAPVARVVDGGLRLNELRWGFDGFNGQSVMNARTETAHEKRMFRDAWRDRHCLVPCDGFYEWKDTPEGKQPYRFVLKSRDLYWFAGLWENDRFTILTVPAQGCVASMHDRMPAIFLSSSTCLASPKNGSRRVNREAQAVPYTGSQIRLAPYHRWSTALQRPPAHESLPHPRPLWHQPSH